MGTFYHPDFMDGITDYFRYKYIKNQDLTDPKYKSFGSIVLKILVLFY